MSQEVNRRIGAAFDTILSAVPSHDNEFRHRILMSAQYCRAVATIEYRHRVWPYNLLDFSRRAGELWEDICRVAFDNAVSSHYEPMGKIPVFADVRNSMIERLRGLLGDHCHAEEALRTVDGFTSRLNRISMNTDRIFRLDGIPYGVDFKLSFQSNEKGNRNRLSDTAWAYRQWDPRSIMTILVCRPDNNAYLRTLDAEGEWRVRVGLDAYQEIERFTGFPIFRLLGETVDFRSDLSPDIVDYLDSHTDNLFRFLEWLP